MRFSIQWTKPPQKTAGNQASNEALDSLLQGTNVGMGFMGMGMRAEKAPTIVDSITHFPDRPDNSLLYPAQFRALVFPACRKANAAYYRCAQGAYDTVGWKRMFEVFSGPTCPTKPESCENGQWLK